MRLELLMVLDGKPLKVQRLDTLKISRVSAKHFM